jgi:drug/metabolite transporter (DMT)-like permease
VRPAEEQHAGTQVQGWWLILGEPIGWRVVAGGVVILAGIVVVAIER